MSRLIWIYAVCKSILLSPMAVKELNRMLHLQLWLGNYTEKFPFCVLDQFEWQLNLIEFYACCYNVAKCVNIETLPTEKFPFCVLDQFVWQLDFIEFYAFCYNVAKCVNSETLPTYCVAVLENPGCICCRSQMYCLTWREIFEVCIF